jgi:hypothetical protein
MFFSVVAAVYDRRCFFDGITEFSELTEFFGEGFGWD